MAKTPEQLWLDDLDVFMEELDVSNILTKFLVYFDFGYITSEVRFFFHIHVNVNTSSTRFWLVV